MSEPANTVVLLSGGIDSLLCAALAQRDEGTFVALSVDYGQADAELYAAARLCAQYGWRQMRAKVTPFPSSLDASGTNLMPGRNALLLSLAAAILPGSGGRIYIGSNADDHRDYPDCRGEFFVAFEVMQQSQGREVIIKRPLINMTKVEVVMEAKRRGLPLESTVSCYAGYGCGECNACKLRAAAGA